MFRFWEKAFGKKVLEVFLLVLAAAALLASGIWLGWNAGRRVPETVLVSGVTGTLTPTSTPVNFSTFWEVWQAIDENYLRSPSTTAQEKLYGATRGLVRSLKDPYSEFLTPADTRKFKEDITGDFGGVGAQLGTDRNSHIVVIAPLKGTPAERAGLKAKDWIVAVGATSTEGMTIDEAVGLIRGPEGTAVTLSILREGWEKPKDFKIIRANIQVPTVDFEMKGQVAYIALHQFTQDANFLFYQALVKALGVNAKGIVLDLRDNPGGYLEVAVDLAGYFVKPRSLVVKEVGRAVPEQDFNSTGDGALSNFPIVIVMNAGSASASEILAGALRDIRGVKLVGEASFGKGTVQELEPLSDGSALKLTIAYWVLPSGRVLDHDGLEPDYKVERSDDDLAAKRDPQLDKALEVVRAEISK